MHDAHEEPDASVPANRRTLGELLGSVPGSALGAAFGLAAKVRRRKPLHTSGRMGAGVLEVTTPDPSLGVPTFAEPGRHHCVVRWSRALGLPGPLPDVEGFALRLPEPAGPGPHGSVADLLFAGTGRGRVTRFVFAPRTPGSHGPQTTLLPVAAAAGSLVLKVEPVDAEHEPPTRWELAAASAGSRWNVLGTIDVEWGVDQPTRFDPVEHQLPGTRQYPFVRVLREPAYLMARRATRHAPSGD